jgi:epsilon-lactone hydrolase
MPSREHEEMVELFRARPVALEAPVHETRATFEQIAFLFPVPGDVRTEPVEIDGLRAEWVRPPESRPDRVLLYLHGGGYMLGSLNTHRELVARLARALGANALHVDYRLAPENPFPAAVDDATAAYRWLLASGVAPRSITIAGDSAGGGLALATLLALRDAGEPLPAAYVGLSPWTDLEGTGDSAQAGAVDDPMISGPGIRVTGELYLGGADPRTPLASPLYGDFAGLPPMLILVGTREVLLDDSTRLAERARAAGVDVELEVWQDLIHVWPFFGPDMPESRDAVALIAEFTRKHVS